MCCEGRPACHLLEMFMMQEAEAEGASESSGGDESQRPLPDQVSGHATKFVVCDQFAVLHWMLSQLFFHYQLSSHDC